MTSRERVLAAITRREPDRVPGGRYIAAPWENVVAYHEAIRRYGA